MKNLIGMVWLALISVWLASGTAQAQAPASQLSIGTRFVPDFCLESKEADGTVVINKCSALPNQALKFDENTGQILQGAKCLAAPTKGQPLVVTICADVDNQKWNFMEDGTLRNDTGVCADILNFWRDPGTSVIAWDCTATDNQKFFATNVKITGSAAKPAAPTQAKLITGSPVIASYFVQGLCLDVLSNHATVTINVCNRKANQAFHFVTGNSGQITQDGKCLSSIINGEPLALKTCGNAAEQDWTFTEQGTLRNRANVCADILRFDTRAGTDVIGWECTQTDNQKWYPALAAESGTFTLGATIATNLKANPGSTTVSVLPGFSALNLTGAGGSAVSADGSSNITGGKNNTIILGGAGVMTVRFVKGLAGENVKTAAVAGGTPILPRNWSFFSGTTAGSIAPE